MELLSNSNINTCINIAADINFTRPLKESATMNITGSLAVQKLSQMLKCNKFIHVSTQ